MWIKKKIKTKMKMNNFREFKESANALSPSENCSSVHFDQHARADQVPNTDHRIR